MMPLLGIYKNEFEKKSTSDKNTFNNIMRKVSEVLSLLLSLTSVLRNVRRW
jgi:hypothetical protein